MMNPMATKISAKLTRSIRQHTPFVFGQNGLGADIVSITTPALVELLFPFKPLFPLLELFAKQMNKKT